MGGPYCFSLAGFTCLAANMIGRGEFRRRLLDRTLRYAGRALDPSIHVALVADGRFILTKAGQAATITAANLLARMTEVVVLDFPDTSVVAGLPWTGQSLKSVITAMIKGANPFAVVMCDTAPARAYQVNLGAHQGKWLAHGVGWNAYVGPSPSPLIEYPDDNIFGAVFAAVYAIEKLFEGPFPSTVEPIVIDTLNWAASLNSEAPPWKETELGEIWFVGTGSVGSAIAYFLALAGAKFSATLFDMDIVKVENLDRSPVFLAEEADTVMKVDSVSRFLSGFGLSSTAVPKAFDEVIPWRNREPGPPDILFSAANERDVRFVIESHFPPMQFYGTTGQNWQAAVLRHLPPSDPCSCCLFPPDRPTETDCAKGAVPTGPETKPVDASLPFLSFAAGLMAAAEAIKVGLPGFPYSANRVLFYPRSDEPIHQVPLQAREGCVCTDRSRAVHKAVVKHTRFGILYDF